MSNYYDILYVDPPWKYSSRTVSDNKNKRYSKASNHYKTMTFEELADLDIQSISAKNSLMFCWTTGPQFETSIKLMHMWDFEFRTVAFVWHKKRPVMGAYTMSECEFCLLGKRKKGKMPRKPAVANTRQFYSESRTVHSKKPAAIRNMIAKMFPTESKIELFSRDVVQGWDCWGDQVNSTITIPLKSAPITVSVPLNDATQALAMFCEHANEVPMTCQCKEDCYCKEHTCKVNVNLAKFFKHEFSAKEASDHLKKRGILNEDGTLKNCYVDWGNHLPYTTSIFDDGEDE